MSQEKKRKEINLKISPQDVEPDVLWIINRIKKADFKAWAVGGCVRDLILGRKVQDWDVVTSADLGEIFKIFKDYKIVPLGKRFGTVTLVLNKINYEISTFRGRKLKDELIALKEDLCRRDFTINALVWEEKRGIIDYFGGIDDLGRGIIRGIINPAERIKEDPLRMLRAIRLARELNFKIEDITWREIKRHNTLLKEISIERIRDELIKILMSDNPEKGFKQLEEADLLKYILPELEFAREFYIKSTNKKINVTDYILMLLGELPPDLNLRIAALLQGIKALKSFATEKDLIFKVLSRLRFKNSIIKDIKIILLEDAWENKIVSPEDIRKVVSLVGIKNINSFLELRKADLKIREKQTELNRMKKIESRVEKIIRQKPPLSLKDLAVKGTDLMDLGYTEGRKIGGILQRLFSLVIEKPELNQRDILIRIIEKNIE